MAGPGLILEQASTPRMQNGIQDSCPELLKNQYVVKTKGGTEEYQLSARACRPSSAEKASEDIQDHLRKPSPHWPSGVEVAPWL